MSDRLKEIAERVEAATKGPWKWDRNWLEGPTFRDTVIEPGVEYDYGGGASVVLEILDPDRAFIAYAREDIPYLLARVERLEAALREIADKDVRMGVIARRALSDSEKNAALGSDEGTQGT